ncbi:hypothetical protein DV736_g5124, partial [Chaetothyriales sp. CBS 134916]
ERSSKDLQDVGTKPVAEDKEYPTGFRLFVIVAALFTAMFLLALDLTILATAIPKITDEFHHLDHISWYASVFFLTLGGFQSLWGRLYKFFPLKTSFICSILLFELGSLILAVAPSQSSKSYYIMSLGVEPSKRPVYTSILGAAYGIACVLGSIVGAALAARVTWRWCFYINLSIGGAAAVIYFQSIDVIFSTIFSGSFITKTGWAQPVMVVGSDTRSLLVSTMARLSKFPWSIGQAEAPVKGLPQVTAIILSFETIGVSLLLSAAEPAFLNVVVKTLPSAAPGVNPKEGIYTGASEFRSVFTPDQVPGIIKACMRGLKMAFAVSIAAAGFALLVSVCGVWKRIPTGTPQDEDSDEEKF